MSSAAASTEAAFNSFAAVSLKPLLRYIASECIASMTFHDSSIVEFVIKLLSENKEHLENACRIGANRPAPPSASIPAAATHVTAVSHVSQERPYINADSDKPSESNMARLSGSEKNTTNTGKLYEIACDRVAKGFQRRDYHFLRSVYDRFCNGAPDMSTSAVNDALAAAFCFGHNPRSQEELLALLDIDRNGSISRDEFYRAARRAGEVERWLLRLPLASIVSDAISAALMLSSPSPEDDPLRQLSALTSEQLQDTMSASLQGLSRCIGEAITSLQQVFEIQDRATLQQQEGLGSKFSVYKMACGTMEDFHKGLSARIGSPNLDFETSMRAEHCAKAGCDVPFTTTNYGISTTPHLEWLYIVGTEQLEEIDALDSSGEWYQAFIVKRTDSEIFVHFEGKAKSCDETIPLPDVPTRVRERARTGHRHMEDLATLAQMYMFQEVDALDDNKEWYQALIIKRTDAGALVHYEGKGLSNDEMISLTDLPARVRVRCSADMWAEAFEVVVLQYPAVFNLAPKSSDVLSSYGEWLKAWIIEATQNDWLVHYVGKDDRHDERIPIADLATRTRVESKIGELGPERNDAVFNMYDKTEARLEEIDARDCNGAWYKAFIVARTEANVHVHFSGWEMRWDERIPLEDVPTRVRPREISTATGPLGSEENRIVSAMYTLDGEAAKKRYVRTPCPPKDLINIHRSDMPRALPDVEALLSCKTAVKAGLTRPEVIALILYTGPMFQVYNCILRRFPQNIYDVYANSDSDPNLFSTTIFVLVSAVQKLSRSNLIPPGTQLYRGMGGLMDLPDCFLQSDENGCCGYVEWGFMSTTTDRGIAVQYSGVKQGRPKATVMVIHPSSVDRGASIVEFSQYPGEKEFLWVPCSLVQPLGDDATSVEVMHGGLVTVLSVRVNINIKTETVEELVAKKKSMHIAAMKAMIDDLRQDLKSISESEAFKERVQIDHSIHSSNCSIVEHIIQQCRSVLQRHEERDALEFVNDNIYRCLVMQLLDCKSWAKEKLQLWLHDNAEYWEGRFGIKKETLVASHRMWLALQRRLITRAASESLAAQASTAFLQSQGLILQNVAEDTFDDEPIARAAGANGWSLENITALKVAGGDLNAIYSNGWTALLYAARYGATSTVSALIECGAHVNARNSQDESAIILASRSGIASVIKVLAAAKADPNDCDHREGWTCLIWAADNAHADCVKVLLECDADVNKKDRRGQTPVDWCKECERPGQKECLAILQSFGGKSCEELSDNQNEDELDESDVE